MANGFDPDHFVCPGLGPKLYQQITSLRVTASKEKIIEQIPIYGLAHDEISVLIATCRTSLPRALTINVAYCLFPVC